MYNLILVSIKYKLLVNFSWYDILQFSSLVKLMTHSCLLYRNGAILTLSLKPLD